MVPDNVVTVILRSGPHFVAALFGTMLPGAIPSPLAPPMVFQDATRYDEHVRTLVGRAGCSAVITSHDLIERVPLPRSGGHAHDPGYRYPRRRRYWWPGRHAATR